MKSAVVIGSCGGIGSAICQVLLSNNWRVFGGDIADQHPADLVNNANYSGFKIDITRQDSFSKILDHELFNDRQFDAIIYAAGTYDHFPLAESPPNRLENIIAVNVNGAANTVSAFFPYLNKNSGRIIFISSETAMASLPFQVYGVSKRMLEVYTDSLRQELAFINMPVVLIRPGAHSTTLLDKSRSALADFPDTSLFAKQLKVVRNQGQRIIDQGASDPVEVGKAVLKALKAHNPSRVYHVNVSLRFRAMRFMPRWLKSWILRLVLGK